MSLPLRRRRAIVATATVALGVVGFAGLASAAGVITLTPSAGRPGTPYVVMVECTQKLTLYGRPVNPEGPPGTIPPLDLQEVSPGTWQIDAVAGQVDDIYGGYCGDEDLDARFDTDNPRMYLGPIPTSPPGPGSPKTTVEGTDCPTGTDAHVTFRHAGRVDTIDEVPDARGDWTTLLPGWAGTENLTINASCGSVTYDPITITVAGTTPTDPAFPTDQCGTQPGPCPSNPSDTLPTDDTEPVTTPPGAGIVDQGTVPSPSASGVQPASGAAPIPGTATFRG